jgi:alcohol dehydrogenase (cytochrome c)
MKTRRGAGTHACGADTFVGALGFLKSAERSLGAPDKSVCATTLLLLLFSVTLFAQTPNDAGRRSFETRCGRCHGGDGKGGEMGPNITARVGGFRSDEQLTALIHTGIPGTRMPATPVEGAELAALLRFVHALEAAPEGERTTADTPNGTISGVKLAQGFDELQVRSDDGKIHLLRRAGGKYREVTSEVDWPQYNGDPGGNRYTAMSQITRDNISRLAPRWMFAYPPAPASGRGRGAPAPPTLLEMTPVVAGGIMYVSNVNDCIALDAGSGRQIWRFTYQPKATPPTSSRVSRGVAVAGDKVYLETNDAHVVAIDRFSGTKVWDSPIADPAQNYSASSAPLLAGDQVITGVTGGEDGANGLVVSFDQSTGKETWRFHVVPRRGEPGSETWKGKELDHGGGPTWFTGSYDPDLDTVYWPTGNPAEEYNGDARPGDNLYTDCILALDRKTGKLKWYYQFTPHDLWDWDSTETSVLVDAPWQGQTRKLMLHADRNGFYYVLDRTDGRLLLAKQFLKHLTWASGIGADGRPIKLPNQEPSASGTLVCPSQDGATNWYSPSFNPLTGLYYFQTNEKCSVYSKREQPDWVAGQSYLGGTQRTAPNPKPQRILKAIDYQTGEVRWEIPQWGDANSWGGTLSTGTGLVFFEEEMGSLVAADAGTGRILWSFAANAANWHASPMTYQFDGQQYIAVVSGGNVIALALTESK